MKTRHLLVTSLYLILPLLFACSGSRTTKSTAQNTSQPQQFKACTAKMNITQPNTSYVWTPNAIRLVSEQLSEGVFAVYDSTAKAKGKTGQPAATSGGFVIGKKGVLLIDTMINRQLFCQMIGLVRQQTNLPVLYAVNTSMHGDHSYGNHFLPKEVKVVQHKNTSIFITDAKKFSGDIKFMEKNFGADQGLNEIKAVVADILVDEKGWSVDLGNRVVEARYYGFAQTHGDLFVVVPSANVVWTGNPVIAQKPAIPWLLDGHVVEAKNTLIKVRQAFPNATIVPGHGIPVQSADLDFGIAYLETLIQQVDAQVKANATEEQTVKALVMKDFQGYMLWGWVHNQVNVPATYKERLAALKKITP